MRRAVTAALAAGLVACAAPPLRPQTSELLWAAEGRLSIATVTEQGNRLDSGRFAWTESSQASEIALYSPLGDTLGEVRIESDRATLRLPDRTETAPSAELLLSRALGIELPVSGLRHWLRGDDASGKHRAPEAFDEAGWRIAYSQMSPDDPSAPRIVRLERDRPVPIQVRLVVDRWTGQHP